MQVLGKSGVLVDCVPIKDRDASLNSGAIDSPEFTVQRFNCSIKAHLPKGGVAKPPVYGET
jgi:hypothetical protein